MLTSEGSWLDERSEKRNEQIKAALEVCDEIEKLMSEGKSDEAFPLVGRLDTRTEELSGADSDSRWCFDKIVTGLVAALIHGNFRAAMAGLRMIQIGLAVELGDVELAKRYEDAAPTIGSA